MYHFFERKRQAKELSERIAWFTAQQVRALKSPYSAFCISPKFRIRDAPPITLPAR
jgi:hypothetical protein